MTNPRFITVTLTLANTNYQLSSLLSALDSGFNDTAYLRVKRIALQAGVAGGGALFMIGNSDLSATNYGVGYYATQSVLYEHDYGVIDLRQIYVRCDTAANVMNIAILYQ